MQFIPGETLGDQRILFVDPGKMTGWGFLDVSADTADTGTGPVCEFAGGELPHDAFLDWASHAITNPETLNPRISAPVGIIDLVVVEGFVVGPRTIQQCPDDRSLWSVKQIGVLEMFCRWAAVPCARQLPADKSFGTDTMLKRIGWWAASPGVKGEAGHRRDAARHALKYAVDHQIINLRSLLP